MAKQINIIPAKTMDANKTYRQALGYCWQDYDNKIPGDDRILPNGVTVPDCVAGIIDELRAEYGDIVVCSEPAYSRDDLPVARITRMWCGGGTQYIYAASPNNLVEPKPDPLPLDATETAIAEYQSEALDIAEQDRRNAGQPGYCAKCHTYCYGDCEANNA